MKSLVTYCNNRLANVVTKMLSLLTHCNSLYLNHANVVVDLMKHVVALKNKDFVNGGLGGVVVIVQIFQQLHHCL